MSESRTSQRVTRLMGVLAIAVGLAVGGLLISGGDDWFIGALLIVLFCGAGLAMLLIPQHWKSPPYEDDSRGE